MKSKSKHIPITRNIDWKFWAPDWRTAVSGFLIVISFPPWNFWPFIWIALIPWFFAIHKASHPKDASKNTPKNAPKNAMIQGFWLSYFMSIGGFFWVASVIREFGNLPWAISILGLQIFSIFGQPQFFIFAPLSILLLGSLGNSKLTPFKQTFLISLFFAFLYTGLDWILPKLFMDTLGHCLYLAKYLRQSADLGGAPLLTFVIFFVNFSLFLSLKKRSKPQWQLIGAASCFLALFWLYGLARYQSIQKLMSSPTQTLQAAAIQGNIGDFEKVAAERGVRAAATQIINVFTQMSDEALRLIPQPQVIIWPETSYPSTFRHPQSALEITLNQRVEQYVRTAQVPLIFGGYDQLGKKDYNAMFILSPEGYLQAYHKNILLMFGEYIPGAETFSFIRNAFPQVGNFARGEGVNTLEVPIASPSRGVIKTVPIICYEALFPSYVIAAARQGSQLIINITNDSWFGKWGEPQLHLALTSFRSIETRLPMLRSTNTGISALIQPDGEITHPTSIDRKEILNVSIPINQPIPTLMTLWGDWFGPFSLGVTLCAVIAIVRFRWKNLRLNLTTVS